ncbi:hypothetical protein GCM10022243_20010 [Saccharothrix violaceirubra]|uniref:N-acyl amino acid synthase FeeM catalytic core domain-containing protein n=1 Tax=Saccharothrix violaceirubra TaxID=413306 RepID=A0A7W7T213_9PSEU|nr:GNAT family N-acyltransferase [Saccharothrix violaceirubra]MBB4965094.1 hypothetical protein [Saccharothrix violaceirubra]
MGWKFVEPSKDPRRPLRIYRATTAEHLDRVDLLWKEVYGRECGWLAAGAGTPRTDGFHPHSVYLLADVDGETVGTMRLVRDSPEQGLPVGRFLPVADLKGPVTLECQRLMVLAEHRRRRWPELPFGVLAALIKACLHWCVRTDVTHVLADVFLDTATTPMAPLVELGFAETGRTFVDTELHEPSKSTVLVMRINELVSRSFRADNPFYRYLMDFDPIIDLTPLGTADHEH